MQFVLPIFVLMLTAYTPVFAEGIDCPGWLDGSAFGRLASGTALTVAQENELRKLQQAYSAFQDSPFRGNVANYELLLSYLQKLEQMLRTEITTKETELTAVQSQYNNQFGALAQLNPWGAAAKYAKANIDPISTDLAALRSALTTLEQISTEARAAKTMAPFDTLIREAKIIMGLVYSRYQTEAAVTFAKLLIGMPGDIHKNLATLGELFVEFERTYNRRPAIAFTAALVGNGLTDESSKQRLKHLYRELRRYYTDNAAVGLTVMAFNKKMTMLEVPKIRKIYDPLRTGIRVADSEVLPIASYFLQLNQIPTEADIQQIEGMRKRIFNHAPQIQSFDSTIMLGLVLTIKGLKASEQDIQVVLNLYDAYSRKGANHTAATLLAIATFLVTDKPEEVIDIAVAIWQDFMKPASVTQEAAAGMSFKILISRFGVNQNLFIGVKDRVVDIPNAIQQTDDSYSIFDPLQGAITGDFINLDGNPFTEI